MNFRNLVVRNKDFNFFKLGKLKGQGTLEKVFMIFAKTNLYGMNILMIKRKFYQSKNNILYLL